MVEFPLVEAVVAVELLAVCGDVVVAVVNGATRYGAATVATVDALPETIDGNDQTK